MTTKAMATSKRFSTLKGPKWHFYDANSLIITEFTEATKTSHIYWNIRPFLSVNSLMTWRYMLEIKDFPQSLQS